MSKAFSLGSILNEKTLSQAKNTHKVVYLDINSIVPNPANDEIYNTDGVEMLSYSIEDKGLLQPLVVRKINGTDENAADTYEVISGHRRRLAILDIIERNSEKAKDFAFVPCIVRPTGKVSDAESGDSEIKEALIDGNLFNRHKTEAEIAKEIAIKKDILETRKKSGEKIAGKILSMIASEMGISNHQAKKYNAINKNASDEVKDAYEKGEISTEAAYQLSKADEDTQKEILEKNKDKDTAITSKDVMDELNKKKTTTTAVESTDVDETVGELVGESIDETVDKTDYKAEEKSSSEHNGVSVSAPLDEETNEKDETTTSHTSILTPFPEEATSNKRKANNTSNTRFDIITKLASLMKKFNQSSEPIEFNSGEIKEALATLELTYNYVMENQFFSKKRLTFFITGAII